MKTSICPQCKSASNGNKTLCIQCCISLDAYVWEYNVRVFGLKTACAELSKSYAIYPTQRAYRKLARIKLPL